MRVKKQISILMTAALLAGAMPLPASMADEVVIEGDEVIPEEEVQIDDPGADITDDSGSGGDAGSGDSQTVQDDFEDIPLIEDDGLEVVNVTDGADLTAVVTAESEADAAAEKIRELMDELPVELEQADSARLEEYLRSLLVTADPTGSDGELEVGAFIEETMRSFGYTVSEQHFHEGFLNEDLVDVPGVNIIAERGANSDMADRTRDIILVCAHYDSKTKPGADDPLANDKSGAAALLETARILQDVDTNVDLCFMFLSGEEDGYYGTLRLAEGLSKEIKGRIRSVIYVGSVGYVWGTIPEGVSAQLQSDEQTQGQEDVPGDSGIDGQDDENSQDGQAAEPADVTGEADSAANAAENAAENAELTDPTGEGLFLGEDAVYVRTAAVDQESQAMEADQTLSPYLIGVPTDEGNDPGELLRALGQYRAAREVLAGDVLPEADTLTTVQEPAASEWEQLAAYEERLARIAEEAARAAAEAAQGADGAQADTDEAPVSTVVNAPEKAAVDETAAARRLELLNALADWRLVTGQAGSLQYYADNGMTVTQVLQPVDAEAAERALLRLVKADGETDAGNEGAGGSADASDISDALGAAPVDDVLLQAGQADLPADGQAVSDTDGLQVPILSTRELADFSDYLAAAVSLYMRSQTSLDLEQ